MKLSKLAIASGAAALAIAGFSSQALAADGTITFSGKIITSTCTVTTGTGGNFTVNLPLVTANATTLNTSGQVAGTTAFSIDLTGCPTTPSGVQVASSFSGSNINAGDGNLNNTGTASNVELQLLNGDSSVIDLSGASANGQNSKYTTINGSGAATLNYKAQYYATGTTGAGTVASSIDYTLVYQ